MKKTMILFTLIVSGTQLFGMEEASRKTKHVENEECFIAWIDALQIMSVEEICCKLMECRVNNFEIFCDSLNGTIEYYKKNNQDSFKYIQNFFKDYLIEQGNVKFFFECIKKAQTETQNKNFQKALEIYELASKRSTATLKQSPLIKDAKKGIRIQIAQIHEILGNTKEALEIYREYPLNRYAIEGLLNLDPENIPLKNLIVFIRTKHMENEFDQHYTAACAFIKKNPKLHAFVIDKILRDEFDAEYIIAAKFLQMTPARHHQTPIWEELEIENEPTPSIKKLKSKSDLTSNTNMIIRKAEGISTADLSFDLFKDFLTIHLSQMQIEDHLKNEKALIVYQGTKK